MPAIRDATFSYNTSVTTSLSCPLPTHEQNDLLIALCTADTGSQTWTATGWTQLFSNTYTVNMAVMYKIAGASETTPTFNYTVTETANINIISIRDVDTTTPIHGSPGYATSNITGAVNSVPTITTTVDDCLLLYVAASSSTGVPSFIDGPITQVVASNGQFHSSAIGWTMLENNGTSASTANSTRSYTVAAQLGVIAIAPPSGGATVLPAYCPADSSEYLNPIHGTLGYNGDSGMTGLNFTTKFASTIDGQTTANGTAVAATFTGLNPFHSMLNLTGTTTDGDYRGAQLTFATANRPDVTGKNLLIHTMPSQPRWLINTDSVTKSTSKGIGFGMVSSNATDFKFWAVHGSGTSWDSATHLPLVINEAASGGLIHDAGTLTPSSILSIGVILSGTVTAPQWRFGSLWLLDTTTVAGGNATEPVGIEGLWNVCAYGKERMSVLKQGASQAMILQPIQFGDGGTNSIYLELDSTAIEFPSQYNVDTKQTFYCSTDNVAGITYYAGASDTIKHINSVVSSPSAFHWRIHPSSSSSASYDFSGLSVIGAGDVDLLSGVTFDGISFANCAGFTQNSATITNASFTDTTVNSAAPGDADNISYSSFTSSGTGHGIEIGGTAANITLNGITFTGYASTDGSTGNEAIYVNIATGSMNITIANGGSTPSIKTAGCSVTVLSGAVTVKATALTTAGAAIQSARVLLKASDGTGPFPFEETVTISNSGTTATVTHTAHGMETNDYVQIKGGSLAANQGVFQITVTNANTYTYTMSSTPGSSPTGTIEATFAALYGLTDVNGEISATRVYSSNQPVTGWIRKSSSSPYYKEGLLVGTVNSSAGFDATGVMASDE